MRRASAVALCNTFASQATAALGFYRRKRNRSHTIRHRLREQVLRAISQLALLPLLEQQGKLFAALAARPEKSGTSGAGKCML